jgi:hypothetical protein
VHAVLWVALLLVLELVVALVLLGTWIAEGRRRAEDLDRLMRLADQLDRQATGRGGPRRPADAQGSPGG